MPLSPNEIRDRALAFARDWKDVSAERAEAQSFWNDFFNVFGVPRRKVARFEEPVKRARARMEGDLLSPLQDRAFRGGFIDLFWPGMLIAEHKSRGKDLDTAYKQALDYFDSLKDRDLPRYVIVSDFARIRLHDLEEGQQHEITLAELPKRWSLFGFIAGYSPLRIREQDPVNIKAAERMGRLYDHLEQSGYSGHELKLLLVRLLFCLYADDTTIFDPKGAFQDYLEDNTHEDGSDLGATLVWIFEILNTPIEVRQRALDERVAALPYVNGRLFEERLHVPAFDGKGRQILLDCCALDWGHISPAIFGALFQSVMDKQARRNLGAHYTSEQNILKVIEPLFMNELRAELVKAKRSRNKLFELHKKIARLKFLDPACGCGNFLVIAYRELRLLELDLLRAASKLERRSRQRDLALVQVNVDQFYGIEIEEFPGQIAQVALWLTDHQMNLKVSEEFGFYFRRLPLVHSATIAYGPEQGNALRIDWENVISADQVDYVFGNPPFGGAKYQSPLQREEMSRIFEGVDSYGLLDYVAAWYLKTVHYLLGQEQAQFGFDSLLGGSKNAKDVKVAFVSTNSITQGEQVGVFWTELLRLGVKIHFAHRTFQWQSEARGKAAVHCVIIGFALFDAKEKWIYDYSEIKGQPIKTSAQNINPYLVDAPDVLIGRRSTPLCDVPKLKIGNKPIDGGHYLFTEDEKRDFLQQEPLAERYFRPWLGADEFLYRYQRWCLWLRDCPPAELRRMPAAMERVKAVQAYRLNSKSKPTQKLAQTPTRFHVENFPNANYLVIPEVTSERRQYLPIDFMCPQTLASNLLKVTADAGLYHFGILSSAMHMAWLRYVAGRLKSDYRYSGQIVYNNFPWPDAPSDKAVLRVEKTGDDVLKAREQFPDASLADLYDPVAMPPALRKAHTVLDRAVDAAYGKRRFDKDADRVAFLFELYQRYTSLLPAEKPSRRRARRAHSIKPTPAPPASVAPTRTETE